jgi:hypothetical protein
LALSFSFLFGCSTKTVDSEVSDDAPPTSSTPGIPASGFSENGTEEEGEVLESTLLAPYEISEFINRDFIFRGEILSVENVSSTLTYKGEVQDTYEESLLTVRVDEVYAGEIPGGKKEIVLYCPASNKNSNEWGLALSPNKSYVFFTMYWNDELLSELETIGYSQYGYDKRSDVYLPTNIYSLFIAKDGFIYAQDWTELAAPTDPQSLGLYEELYLALKEEYGAKNNSYIAGICLIYSEEDFRKAFEQGRKLYR